MYATTDSYKWQLGPCHSSHIHSTEGTYTEQCCVQKDEHILSCKSYQNNGWTNGVVKLGRHQFCDDFVGYNQFIKINIPGRIKNTLPYMSITRLSISL